MSKPPPLRGDGPFSSEAGFAGFLSETGRDPEPENAFPARNFLLDEGVATARVESYRVAGGVAAHGGVPAWTSAHTSYLADHIHRTHGGSVPDPAEPDECPETFHAIDPGSPFVATDGNVHLLRMIAITSVAERSKQPPREVQALAEALVGAPGAEPARTRMDDILPELAKNCDLRPVFAAFWDDHERLFGKTPADDTAGWADTFRDRCGLSHLDPGGRGGPIPVLVFRYPVKAVARMRGARLLQPLVPPTVLDSWLSAPFCPAPRNSLTGVTVDLSGAPAAPRREVLHPFTAFRASHLFRVGTIRRPFAPDMLPTARGMHLLDVRASSGRADYAAGTDGDLL